MEVPTSIDWMGRGGEERKSIDRKEMGHMIGKGRDKEEEKEEGVDQKREGGILDRWERKRTEEEKEEGRRRIDLKMRREEYSI